MKKFENIREELNLIKGEILLEGVDHPEFKSYDRKAKNLMEIASFSLLATLDQKARFFGILLSKGNRQASYTTGRAITHQVRNHGVVLIYNPLLIVDYTIDELKLLMAKEASHIVLEHFKLQSSLRDVYPWVLVKLACEMEVAEVLRKDNLPGVEMLWSKSKIEEMFDITLEGETALEFLSHLFLLMNNNEEFHQFVLNTMDDDLYCSFEDDPLLMGETIKYIVIETSSESRGNLPTGLASKITDFMKPPVITWEEELARFVGSISAGTKPSMFRRNRRQPGRLDLKGQLPDKEIDLVVAIDTSGSLSNSDVEKFMTEIFDITKHIKTNITIIECDCYIQKVYEVSSKEDIDTDVVGRGGTLFAPVFDWMQENNKSESALIYMTDGFGEDHMDAANIHQGTLWVLTGNKEDLSLKGDNLPLRSKVVSLTNN